MDEYTRIAEELKDLTSVSMARGKDIEKKKFLVELKGDLFQKLAAVVDEVGVSRNLLLNLLVEYYLDNKDELNTKLLER